MPLILAIEPDRRQASQLTAMVRGRLHAELVLAESAERALTALGDRVPDLVLTSALLSPKDETAVGDRLRALDGKAAHVQTLTIPVLATTSSRGSGRAGGVLSALRRDKNRAAAPEGCDPAVFAEQCKEYLERAATERAALLEHTATAANKEPVRPVSPSPVTGAEWVVVRDDAADNAADNPSPIAASDAVTTSFDETPADNGGRADQKAPLYTPPEYRIPTSDVPAEYESAATEVTTEDDAADSAPAAAGTTAVAEIAVMPAAEDADSRSEQVDSTEPATTDDGERSPRVDRVIREFLDLTSNENEGPASLLAAVAALEAEEQRFAVAAAAEATSEPPVESMPAASLSASDDRFNPTTREDPEYLDLSSLLQPSSGSKAATADVSQSVSEDVYEIDAQAERLATLSDLEDIFRNNPEFAPTPAPKPAPAKELENLKEWEDIVEALRRDAEQLEARRPASGGDEVTDAAPPLADALDVTPAIAEPIEAPEAAAEAQVAVDDPADGAPADPNGAKRRRKRSKTSPAQDEWGFFDPDQCGFAALIEKLEEINDKDDTPAPRGA